MPSELGQSNGLPPGASSAGPQFITGGLGAPTFTNRSVGTRMVLHNTLSGSAADVAIGVESGPILWNSVPSDSGAIGFGWYAGTTRIGAMFGGASQSIFSMYRGSNSVSLIPGSTNSSVQAVGTNCTARLGTSGFETVLSNDTAAGSLGIFTNSTRRIDISNSGDIAISCASTIIKETSNTHGLVMISSTSALGDIPAGGRLATFASGSALGIYTDGGGTVGTKVVIGANNGSAWRSVFETANVASGEPNAILCLNGGTVLVGASSGLAGAALDVNGLTRLRGGVVESGVTRRTSGASYTMLTGDRIVVFASGSSGTFTLISSPETGRSVYSRNDSGGNITLTPASGNINGAGTLAQATGTGVVIIYDGTQWITI